MISRVAKIETTELLLYYMNRSSLSINAHELVTALRTPFVMGFVFAISVLLALPETSLSKEVPVLARLLLSLFSTALFLGLATAAVRIAALFAAEGGWDRLHLCVISTPSAIVVAILTQTAQLLLLGIPIERDVLLTQIVITLVFWELVFFILIYFYTPALIQQRRNSPPAPVAASPSLLIGGKPIAPSLLLRIQTNGRQLQLHFADQIGAATANLRDVLPILQPYGMLVHRRHWVSFAQLGPIHRQGRTLIMTTRAGAQVPISRDRRKDIEAMLQGPSAP